MIIIVFLIIVLIFALKRSMDVSLEKERIVQTTAAILEIAGRVAGASELPDLTQYILGAALKLIPKAKYGIILSCDAEGMLSPVASSGYTEAELAAYHIKLEESPIYSITAGQVDKTIRVNRLQDHAALKGISRFVEERFPIKSEISSPLHTRGRLSGLLSIGSDQPNTFSEGDVTLIESVASQLRIVLSHQELCREIQRLTRYDDLTRLLNRASFEYEAVQLLADPSKDTAHLYFVLMDLDEMRDANDRYGHNFGDAIIKGFSEIITKHLGRNAICGRYGGDEFAAVIQGENTNVSHLLEEIKNEFKELRVGGLENANFTPQFSYGLVSFRDGSCSLPMLYRLADQKMREAREHTKKNPPERFFATI